MPPGKPLQQIHLGVAGSDIGGQLGPFIIVLDTKLIISDHETTSQKISRAVVSNYSKKWLNIDVFGLYKAGTTGDRPIIWYICTLISLIFLLKI